MMAADERMLRGYATAKERMANNNNTVMTVKNYETTTPATTFNLSEETLELEMAEEIIHRAMSMLPDELTAAYREASRFVPELIRKESDPRWFLSFHPSDPIAAALRLANYWRKRKEIFEERTFLPINFTGNGALTEDDVKVLRTGYIVNLPRDNKGRSVLYMDVSKKHPHKNNSSYRRIFFFGQCIMENEVSRKEGFVFIRNISNPYAAYFAQGNGECVKFLIASCLPIRAPKVHIVHIEPPGINFLWLKTLSTLATHFYRLFYGESVNTHVASSPEDCLTQLTEHDCFSPEGLPVSVGGTWSGGCEPWRKGCGPDDDELAYEIEADKSCLTRNVLWSHNQYLSSCLRGDGNFASSSATNNSHAANELLEDDRKIPAASSTTHHQRDHANAATQVEPPKWGYPRHAVAIAIRDPVLQQCTPPCASLRPRHEDASDGRCRADHNQQRVHNRVETDASDMATDTAKRAAEEMPQDEEEDQNARRRRLHAQADRLRRAKGRIEIEVFKEQVLTMTQMNQSLKDEQQRLEGLVQAAIGMTEGM